MLLNISESALGRLSGASLVEAESESLKLSGSVRLVAIGKAAAAMACGVLKGRPETRASDLLVITGHGYAEPWLPCIKQAEIIEAGHPLPDEHSLAAGERLLKFLETRQGNDYLFLISGGTSSLVEVLVPGLELEDLQRVNHWLLASGLSISDMNAVRCRLSKIKGGGLLSYLGNRRVQVLLMSDVSGDDPAVIGSGLLFSPSEMSEPISTLPSWLGNMLKDKADTESICHVDYKIVANLNTALDAFADEAEKYALPVHRYSDELSGDAVETGQLLAGQLMRSASGVHLWGGETTVKLPVTPGRGGRNQQLALAAAIELSGREGIQLLAIGTDGRDGPTPDAGALVDGGTLNRGELAGLDALECLQRADAGTFLEASGDLVSTGPTGTNLRDIVIAMKA